MGHYVRIATLLACVFAAPALQAQADYPSRPVRMIVPFAPGGASDFVARIIQPRLSELLGQTVVVENRSGAAGNIGIEAAVRATPDGYTFLLGNVGSVAINPSIYPKFQYRPLRDLFPITQVVDVPGTLVVHPSLPVKTVPELIDHLKANPNKYNYGSAGASSHTRLITEIFMGRTGTSAVHVPYKGGAGPMITGLVAGEVQFSFISFSSAVGFAKAGRLRMLAVVAPERVEAMPDVPTMPELGYKDMKTGSWQGLLVPKDAPRAVVKKLYDVGIRTMEHPDVVKRLADGGTRAVVSRSPEEFTAFVKAETDRYAKVVKDARIVGE